MIDFRLLLSVFGVIFIAELPDKTALAALVLATRHRPLPVFLGAALALTVQSLIAIAAGGLVSLLPLRAVHVGAGLLFLVSAVFMWRRHDEAGQWKAEGRDDKAAGFLISTWLVFVVVFLAEWGDLTQIATAALAARYQARLTVFLGATAALWAVAALAVFIGNRAGRLLDPDRTKKVAAVVFAALGVALLAGLL
jgi:putative Ca2+/H+ antiporter (TMEM165/GDT1 family)